MDNGQRKRSRDELEDENEEIEIIMSLLSVFIGIIGAWYHNTYLIKDMSTSDNDTRAHQRAIWMRTLGHEPTCISELRVNTKTFIKLCNILRDEGGLIATKNVAIKEIVALFLHILAHDQKNRTIKSTFARSGETISRQFHTVLQAVLKVGKLFIKQQRDGIRAERDVQRWKWFPNAIGALDGTFVELTVPAEVKSKYRNRKGALSTNVLGVCDANLKFLYILPGWEGSASDARVLRDVLHRPDGFKVYKDQYYTHQPRPHPSNPKPNNKKSKKDSLGEAVCVLATSFQEFVDSKKKKEEKPSGIEIHDVVSKISGLAINDVFTVVRKLLNSDVEEFKLLKDLPDEKKGDWVRFLINS